VDKSGSWYAFGSERLGQGRDNVRAYLQETPETLNAIEDRLKEHFGLKQEAREEPESETAGDSGGTNKESE